MPDREAKHLGQQVGEYRLVRQLGGGGFGTVYLTEHVYEHTQAAVKVLNLALTRAEDFKEFLNEARTIRLRHSHIVPLLDFGISRDDLPYLVMEYAPQGTLRDRHRKGERIALSTIVSYVDQIASALQYAHDYRVIHRDTLPPRLRVHVPELAEAVERVVLKALAKAPQDRFERIQTFADALREATQSPQSMLIPGSFTQASLADPLNLTTPLAGTPSLHSWTQASTVPPQDLAKDKSTPVSQPAQQNDRIGFSSTNRSLLSKHHISRRTVVASLATVTGLGIGILALNQVRSRAWIGTPHPPSPGAPHPSPTDNTPAGTPRGMLLARHPSSGGIWTAAWSPNGKYIASSGDDPVVHIWDVTTGKDIFTYSGHLGGQSVQVDSLAWSPDSNRIVTASHPPQVRVWEVSTGKLITFYTGHNPLPGHMNAAPTAEWSPDGTRIVSAGIYDKTAQVWDTTTGKTILTYRGHSHPVWKAKWSPNGKYIASAGNGSIVNGMFSSGEGDIQVWDQDGNHLFTYNDFPYPGDIAWSPDSKLIASTGSDNNIHVWEATSGRPTLKFAGNRPIVWSPDGKYLAVSSTLTAVELSTFRENLLFLAKGTGLMEQPHQQNATHQDAQHEKLLVQQHFGAAAADYVTSKVHAEGPDLIWIMEAAALTGKERVLDVATGTGHTAFALAPYATEVVAVDFTVPMLAAAQQVAATRQITNVRFVEGDTLALPFAEHSFDLIACRKAAHHFSDVGLAVREWRRVAKPDGKLLLVDSVAPEEAEQDAFLQEIEILRDSSHIRNYRVSEWLSLLQESGWIVDAPTRLWGITLDVPSWTQRIRTPVGAVAKIEHLLRSAPAATKETLHIEEQDSVLSFVLPTALFVCTVS